MNTAEDVCEKKTLSDSKNGVDFCRRIIFCHQPVVRLLHGRQESLEGVFDVFFSCVESESGRQAEGSSRSNPIHNVCVLTPTAATVVSCHRALHVAEITVLLVVYEEELMGL